MKRFKMVAFSSMMLLAAVMMMVSQSGCTSNDNAKTNTPISTTPTISAPAVELKTSMRKLWEEHVTWTRNVILCLVDDVPGTEQAVKRLLQNQVDIGNALAPYYGDPAAKKLTELLYQHINIATEVIKSAKAEDSVALDAANKKWAANGDEIAVFLSTANPNWSLADMKMMMADHLKLTTDEVVQRIAANYDGDVMAYDKVHSEILKMSDVLSNGITKQFPAKF